MSIEWRKYLKAVVIQKKNFYYVSKIEKFKKCKTIKYFLIIKCNGEKERNFSHKTSFIKFHMIQILLIIGKL
jgi:hypothetical protein